MKKESRDMPKNITLPTAQEMWGDEKGNGQLQVFKDYGLITGISDLAILQGGFKGGAATLPTGFILTASPSERQDVRASYAHGSKYSVPTTGREGNARPVLPPWVTSEITFGDGPDQARYTKKIDGQVTKQGMKGNQLQLVEYGEYPQTVALDKNGQELSEELEDAFKAGALQATGKTYTFDGEQSSAYGAPFEAKEYAEYRCENKRYIRVEAHLSGENDVLSTGTKPEKKEVFWLEVQPIEWLVDPSGAWVAKQALFSGVQFDDKSNYTGEFKKTNMHRFLNGPFWKDIQVASAVEITDQQPSTPYNQIIEQSYQGKPKHAEAENARTTNYVRR